MRRPARLSDYNAWPMLTNTAVADGQDDWRLTKNTPQDRLEVNAHSTPQWNYTPEGALASSPQVGLGGAGLGLRSSELYLKCICSKKNHKPRHQQWQAL